MHLLLVVRKRRRFKTSTMNSMHRHRQQQTCENSQGTAYLLRQGPQNKTKASNTRVPSFPNVRVQSHAFVRLLLGRLGAVCVASFQLPQCTLGASCRCLLLWALFVCFPSVLFALVSRVSVLECGFWGFPMLFSLLHLFPLLHLFVGIHEYQANSADREKETEVREEQAVVHQTSHTRAGDQPGEFVLQRDAVVRNA